MKELSKGYDPKSVESEIYKKWEASGFFNPDNLPGADEREPYCIMFPPANVTGVLHLGHALTVSIEDLMIRHARMIGKKTLYLPGTDHAAIATQSKVEKIIYKKEKKNRHDLGREELLRRVEEFASKSHDTIIRQVKSLGASCDWSREAYTLDETRNLAVRTIFKKMYDDGLIYRGDRIVNWDPKGQTTISDDEIVYKEERAKLYTFRYSKDFPIAISTTRPETKVGDTAVAVNPDDDRYKEYVGKEYDVKFCGVDLHIKIIADKEVDKDFGTGALGVTPSHSIIDWELAEKHGLNKKTVINEYAKMTIDNPDLKDMKVKAAREYIVNKLREEGLLEKEEEIDHSIATAERTGGIVEPLPKLQWFISVDKPFVLKKSKISDIKSGEKTTLKEILVKTVESGDIEIVPEHMKKTYFNWVNNLRDWCISRQVWYGHRVPVWYKEKKVYCGVGEPDGEGWKQDEDTLDTWFSAGLWTFSTLGWPEETEDFKTYHPTSVLETGKDIIFFWVARMILMTGYALGEVPFRDVYLHGMVRDSKGQKMSKSLGNSIDPIEVAEKFGTDAVRMALVATTKPGTDQRYSEEKTKAMKHFANKLWNINRYILIKLSEGEAGDKEASALISKYDGINFKAKSQADKDVLKKFEKLKNGVSKNIDNYYFHEAAQALYHFAWHEFADKYIEISKEQWEDNELRENTYAILVYILRDLLKMLHPFMPFVTEYIWGIWYKNSMLMVESWPKPPKE